MQRNFRFFTNFAHIELQSSEKTFWYHSSQLLEQLYMPNRSNNMHANKFSQRNLGFLLTLRMLITIDRPCNFLRAIHMPKSKIEAIYANKFKPNFE